MAEGKAVPAETVKADGGLKALDKILDAQQDQPDPNQGIKDLLMMTGALANDLGNLSTQAVRIGNYGLASRALKYAKGLIEASDEVVRGLEDGAGK